MRKIIIALLVAAAVVGLAFSIAGNSGSSKLGSVRTIVDEFTAGLSIGDGGTTMASFKCATASYNPPVLGAVTSATSTATTTVTVSGATVGSLCDASLTTATGSVPFAVDCSVIAANTVQATFWNGNTATLDMATGTLRACVTKF